MAFSILIYPHQGLKTKAAPVIVFDEQLHQTLKALAEAMYEHDGIGLAATQVNLHQRIFVMDISQEQNQVQYLINPEIIERVGKIKGSEGCLSFPGLYIEVERAENITVRYQDEYGKFHEASFEGIQAKCIQHELDHLDGIVFTDRLSQLKRERALKKYMKLLKEKDSEQNS